MADLSWRKGLSLTITHIGDDPQNLVPNPRFANNITDGWSLAGSVTPTHLVGGTPTLPPGMTAKLKLSTSSGTGTFRIAQFLEGQQDGNGSVISVTEGTKYAFSAWVYNPDQRPLITRVYWADKNGDWCSPSSTDASLTGGSSGFTWCSVMHTAPSGAAMCQPSLYLTDPATPAYQVQFTGVMFSQSETTMSSTDYRDGAMTGYRWEGERHNSYSLREMNRTWEIAREAQGIDFTTKMPGGFSKLSFVVSRSATRAYDDLKRNNEIKLALNGASLFEGWIHSVEPELGDNQRIRVTCHGPWARYGEDQTWRRVYRDTSLRAWKTDQNNDNAGIYYHDKADRLHIRIAKGMTAPSGSVHRLYYWLFDGIPEGDRITQVSFHWETDLGGSSDWIADIMGRDDPDNSDGEQLLWSKAGTVSSGDTTLPVTVGCRCLVLRLHRTSSETTTTGDRFVKLTNVAVNASPVTSVRVDTVVADIAAEMATSVVVPAEGATYAIDHAAFRRFTSRARAIRRVCHYVDGDYDYAVWEDKVFSADDRPDGAAIPANKTIVVQADRPGMVWNVRRDFDKAFDGVKVRYKVPEKGEGKQLVELTRPAGGYSRLKVLDHTHDHHMTTRMAAQIAARYLRRWKAGTERGDVTLVGDVVTKNGVTVPAVTLRAGMWIENISLPGHRPLFISKVRTNLDTGEVTLRINDGDRRHLKHVIKAIDRQRHGAH
jgi:hypothetical protein